jgi:hypothetical protein
LKAITIESALARNLEPASDERLLMANGTDVFEIGLSAGFGVFAKRCLDLFGHL